MKNNSSQDSNLKALLEKYMSNTCSKEELEQFLDLAKEGSGEIYEELNSHWTNLKNGTAHTEKQWNELFSSTMERFKNEEAALRDHQSHEQLGTNLYPVGAKRRKLFLRVAAAAAVILVLSTTFLILSRNNGHEIAGNTEKQPVVQDIKPGGDRAVLTLADGSNIILDSVSNGALTQQGGMRIIKLGGQISYTLESNSTEVLYNTVSTPKGGQYQLELADGSKIWLNAASSLRFPTSFIGKERVVELTGEGYFEVAHNAKMPFHVKVNPSSPAGREMDVQVLGTKFNINSYTDEPTIRTTLLEGKVMVGQENKSVYLKPGQQAILQQGQDNIKVASDVDLDEVVAWKNGHFLFNATDLETATRQLARWYDVNFIYEKEIRETVSGGIHRTENLSQLLKIMEETGNLRFGINGRNIIVELK